jgi:hypothetical protein
VCEPVRWPLPEGQLLALPPDDIKPWRWSMTIMEPAVLPFRSDWLHCARYDALLDYVERRVFEGDSELFNPEEYLDADAVFFRLGWVAFELFCNRQHCGVERRTVNLLRSVRRRLQHATDDRIVAAINVGLAVGFLVSIETTDTAGLMAYPMITRNKKESSDPGEIPAERWSQLRTLVTAAGGDGFPTAAEIPQLDTAVSVAILESREPELLEAVAGANNGETIAVLKQRGFIKVPKRRERTR